MSIDPKDFGGLDFSDLERRVVAQMLATPLGDFFDGFAVTGHEHRYPVGSVISANRYREIVFGHDEAHDHSRAEHMLWHRRHGWHKH